MAKNNKRLRIRDIIAILLCIVVIAVLAYEYMELKYKVDKIHCWEETDKQVIEFRQWCDMGWCYRDIKDIDIEYDILCSSEDVSITPFKSLGITTISSRTNATCIITKTYEKCEVR